MKVRDIAVVALVAAVISAGVGFGLSQASEPDGAAAAKSNATVKQLVQVNRNLDDISDKLASSSLVYDTPLAESLEKICTELKQSLTC